MSLLVSERTVDLNCPDLAIVVFEITSAYGTVGLSLGAPVVRQLLE